MVELQHITEGITGEEAARIVYENDEAAIAYADSIDEKKLDASDYTAADVLAKLLSVGGSGSNLDADKVDGVHIWTGTKAEYEALESKDANTLYVVRGETTYLEILVEAKAYADEKDSALRDELIAADSAVLAAVRGGASDGYNTLKKLQTYIEAINTALSGTDTPDVIDTLNEALAFIREHRSEIESLVHTYIKKDAIADNLTTDDATKVLSARQGIEITRQIGERATAASLNEHVSDTTKHVTAGERTGWNAKLDASAYTAADVLAKLKTVDGNGSGLEADLLTDQVSGNGLKVWVCSEAQYNASSKDPNTLYIVR